MDRVGGSERVRDTLVAALAEGNIEDLKSMAHEIIIT